MSDSSCCNPFVFACITPHGGEVIPELAPDRVSLMATTRESMRALGQKMAEANPDVIIVVTPHGIRLDGFFAISDCERMTGEVDEGGPSVTLERQVCRTLARGIVDAAQARDLPVAAVNYATAAGPLSCLPLDWGAIVPLWFMPKTEIVVLSPSRTLSMEQHIAFGAALADAVHGYEGRVGLIASCDWAHAHAQDGPYGFNEAARQLDDEVIARVESGQLEDLAYFDADFIEAAKPDGIWQALILAGAIPPEERQVKLLSYEVPTYFGLLCAEVTPG
ncbi:extradiol ring-cleavage dioxygenase [Alicyclobacillus sp. ALC3]|uniref:DODA-type extradiol aromatic ring-opening family dioxygenase n=1 Tax=Alicyclobacillus sp. ALC3 TaxID=2796143 RepID=UPI002378B41D|nr:extradiol ring-cleavage dioxygenase [Alicyclobacillus sp. ALC3]WDL96209.1 extradiol ring-cleavage dioxygenase [Alicyclobacillus sp. ALC3]